jgi:hypothetical protein
MTIVNINYFLHLYMYTVKYVGTESMYIMYMLFID